MLLFFFQRKKRGVINKKTFCHIYVLLRNCFEIQHFTILKNNGLIEGFYWPSSSAVHDNYNFFTKKQRDQKIHLGLKKLKYENFNAFFRPR